MLDYILGFDTTFKDWLFQDLSNAVIDLTNMSYLDTTLNPANSRLTVDIEHATENSQLFINDVDRFNALSLTKDFKLIIIPDLIKTFETKTFRVLYYNISIDYNPLKASKEGMVLMNHLLNFQESPDSTESQCLMGMYKLQTEFINYYGGSDFLPGYDRIGCIMFTKPLSQKINQGKANYLRWSTDINFILSINRDIEFFAECQRIP